MPECAEDDTFALQQVPFLKVANDRVLLLTMSESSLMECQNSVALTEDGRGWIDPDAVGSNGKPAVTTLHGTARATFRTWAKDDKSGNNRKFDQEAVEMCLLHSRRDMYKVPTIGHT